MRHRRNLSLWLICAILASASPARAADTFEPLPHPGIFDTFSHQVEACWNIPVSAAHGEPMLVDLRVAFTIGGMLDGAPQILDQDRYASDEHFRTSTDSAIEAITRCQTDTRPGFERTGYSLPREHYDEWQTLRLTFDPADVLP